MGSTLKAAILELTRQGTAADMVDTVAKVAEKYSKLGREGFILFLPENWISRRPISLDQYLEAVIHIGRAWSGNVFAGTAYVVMEDSAKPKSVGLALIEGETVKVCEKVFPSKAVGERDFLDPGNVHDPVIVNNIKIACIACVDIFYPEIARRHLARGAQILYNPASIPYNRLALWRSVLTTRAAENTVYVIGVNSIGIIYPDGRLTGGGSQVVSPTGDSVEVVSIGPLRLAELDLSRIDNARRRWAFYEDLVEGRASRIFSGITPNG